MQIITHINNAKCLEWGLNANQGALFDMLNQSASWAKTIVIDGEVWYWVSRNKVIEELPLYYTKPDTVYRHLKALDKSGLIRHQKHGDKDLVMLTEKGKTWNSKVIDNLPQNNSKNDDKNSSEINPTLGNKSENTRIQIRNSSDSNPTYQHTNSSAVNNQSVSKEFSKLEKPREEKKPQQPQENSENKKRRMTRGDFWVTVADFEQLQADCFKPDIDNYIERYNCWVKESGKKKNYPVGAIRQWMMADGVKRKPSKKQQHLDEVARVANLPRLDWESDEGFYTRIERYEQANLHLQHDPQTRKWKTPEAAEQAKAIAIACRQEFSYA